jgi:acyl-CoA synthetase (AMP-forming)/AMP-acid ligase II
MIDPLHWVAHPNSYLEAATQYGATLGWHPNFAYSFMADRFIPGENPIDLSRIRHLVNCSEPVTAVAQSKFRERFSEFGLRPGVMTGCYAMAETTFAVTHGSKVDEIGIDASGPSNPGTLVDRLPMVSTGRALPGIEIEIRINAINVDDGVIGEIYIRAPFLAHGYLGNAEATERSFENGWYATGDLGYKKGGQVYVIGREKDTIIAAGHNVFPEDIEQEISEDISVRSGRVVVFGEFEQRNQTERVVALAEPADAGVSIDVVALRQQLLTGFGVGVSLYQVEPGWIVKSSSGKPSRSATREKWRSENSS